MDVEVNSYSSGVLVWTRE